MGLEPKRQELFNLPKELWARALPGSLLRVSSLLFEVEFPLQLHNLPHVFVDSLSVLIAFLAFR